MFSKQLFVLVALLMFAVSINAQVLEPAPESEPETEMERMMMMEEGEVMSTECKEAETTCITDCEVKGLEADFQCDDQTESLSISCACAGLGPEGATGTSTSSSTTTSMSSSVATSSSSTVVGGN
eukprot:TRINITY_DN7720_c0_g1_i1.p4 TRINITY_DN7720_c0_g1~~TRINITY_DN7720_c0_g1_i1.p4  ORF type:complete len:125 (+),score=21.54 TRINITY_DN7720_c0_g1_i1:162-536(+)